MKLPVHVWSDVVCPWCWIGKRRLETALSRFDGRDSVELTFHSFELDPSSPREPEGGGPTSYVERLARKYGRSVAEAQAMIDDIAAVAAEDGLVMDFSKMKRTNTFDAHRVLHLAKEHGVQPAVKERLMRGYFAEGAVMSDHETLVRLAADAGLDGEVVRATLAGDAYALAVRADEADAAELGISGVPFFVIGRYGVSGAQPPELLLRVLADAIGEAA